MNSVLKAGYLRRLGTWDAVMIVIGGVIGSGIFRTPASVAKLTDSASEQLWLWLIGGLLTLTGVLCYAELGARRPQVGGTYIYLREAFGRLPAFLFGWTMAFINYPGSVAAVATTFADYFCSATGLPSHWSRPVAVAAISFLVGVNLGGIRAGAWIQNLFTLLKLAAVSLVVAAGLILAGGHGAHSLLAESRPPVAASAWLGALLPVLFAYGGFHYLNDLAGEVKQPQQTLPRALMIGMGAVIVCYLLANFSYLASLGHAGLAASTAPAADTLRQLSGSQGGTWIAWGIACSTFGYCNIAIAGGARVIQTMSADRCFFSAAGRLFGPAQVPRIALLALGGWAVILTLSGSFDRLLDYTTVGEWLAHACGIATLFWYRRQFRDQPAPYRVPWYPWLPLIFVSMVIGVIAATAWHSPSDAGMSLLIIALGVPVYYLWLHRRPAEG